jgi:hypothetical protein
MDNSASYKTGLDPNSHVLKLSNLIILKENPNFRFFEQVRLCYIPSNIITMKRVKMRYRGMFNYPNGRNITEEADPPGENQYVTVFFNWSDRLRNDGQLMDLVVDHIMARDGIITPTPVHHDIRFCLSLRVPRHWKPTDASVTSIAIGIAQWYKSEIIHAGMNIDRSYLFRFAHRPVWRF